MLSGRLAARTLRAAAPQASTAPRVALRNYATPAQDVKPPIPLFGLDGTYASALYTAAAKTASIDPTARALDTLNRMFQSDAKLTSIIAAPTLSDSDKSMLVSELVKTSGVPSSDKTIPNFLKTLAENNRLNILKGVCEKFAELMSAHKGEVEMRVTSAAPLDTKVLRQLETAVGKSQYVGQGKKLRVTSKVQPDIRGGLVVEIGDRTIDLSVSAKMARMNKLLQESL